MSDQLNADVFYSGPIPASKSILNRLLVLRSFTPTLHFDGSRLEVVGESTAEDVMKMRSALEHFERGEPSDCGAAGTTLRFLALRASRVPGTHHLSGSLRLFERPQEEIRRLLNQLGVEVEFGPQRMTIRGSGWQIPRTGLEIDRSVSSQFASGVFLSGWGLHTPLRLRFAGSAVSESYLEMTLKVVEQAGMKLEREGEDWIIPAHEKITAKRLLAELDASSAFAVVALGIATSKRVEILDWPAKSLQPDARFPKLLEQMGCAVEIASQSGPPVLRISRSEPLRAIDCDLRESPDLFPVLSVLCAMARGRSRLFGAPHLAHKESDRIAKTVELLRLMSRKCQPTSDGILIEGDESPLVAKAISGRYDTDHDHRLAMAAAVARTFGASIEILHPQVVNKSFPAFWSIAGQGARR